MNLIRELDSICFPEDDEIAIWHRDQHWWIVYHNQVPTAYGGARRWGEYCFLNRAGVLPSWQGQHLQQLLIKERIKQSKLPIITYTSHDNLASVKNLKACGFRLWKPPEKYYFEGFSNFVLPLSSDIETE